VVKLVHDMKANRGEGQPFACKTLRKGITLKDNVLYSALKPEVLQGECEILRTLAGQEYCLGLIAIYEAPKIIYVVTELCTGGEMMVYVSNQDAMRTEDVSRIAFQLLSAVNHCAKHNVIHRDIKPENVMFRDPTANAELRLIDFGSGVMDPSPMGPEDRHKTFAGSAFYISPEMFQKTYTSKTDVWSTGVTLYVLAAGYPADNLQKAFNILQTSQNRDLSSLPGIPDDMSDSFLDMLDQLLCYRHLRRRTAGEMLQHEFVKFHKSPCDTGLSIEEIVAAANASEDICLNPYATEDSQNCNDSTSARRSRPLQSISMTGSIRRHNAFLNYQQFERSVTTLLATLLCNSDLSEFLKELDSEIVKEAATDIRRLSEDSLGLTNSNPTMLQVVSIFRIREMLKERNQIEW
jgi:serine/threonine protein kinase